MSNFKLYSSTLILMMVFALGGCPSEDENLVNPPSQAERVNIRFVNLAEDKDSREFVLANTQSTGEVPYASSTETFNPPSDSAIGSVLKNGNEEFTAERMFRFSRNITYTFFALPTAPGDSSHPRAVDTLIYFNTLLTIPDVTNDAYVRLFNAYPDTSVTFSLVQGCAGGNLLAGNTLYRKYAQAKPILSGENTFTLVKNNNNETETIGLYSADMEPRGEYSFIVYKGNSGNPEVLFLDEHNPSNTALEQAEEVQQRQSDFRTINFSDYPIDVYLNEDEILSGMQPMQIDEYKKIDACGGTNIDRLKVLVNDDTSSSSNISFEVLKDYSLFVFNRTQEDSTLQVLAEPFKIFENTDGRSILRVINAHPDYEGITVSFGARGSLELQPDSSEEEVIASGEAIANELRYGEISNAAPFESGYAPITFFTSTQPADYITGINYDFQPDQEYTLVLYEKQNGDPGVSIISKDEVMKEVPEIPAGALLQFVNAVPGPQAVNVGLDPLLDPSFAEIFYSLTFATVVPEGQNTIKVNGVSKSFNASSDKRVMIVATGTENNIEIIEQVYDPLPTSDSRYYVRFLNASQERGEVVISNNNLQENPNAPRYTDGLNYMEFSELKGVNTEVKISLYFFEPGNYNILHHRVNDLKLNFRKAYTVIFIGNSVLGDPDDNNNTNNGYTIVLLQEF